MAQFHTNSIGAATFDSMTGQIIVLAEEIEVFQRRGVDSIGARKLGQHARPFVLRTVKYVLDFTAAYNDLVAFRGDIGKDPVVVIKQTVNWGSYLLIDVVEAEPPQACLGVIGSIIVGAEVRTVLDWTMIGG